ncbi:hypothetical protein DSO57_1033320 [Entomophthora muscae]|uniref:Uncharacterized protein n=1 Tax=Entomophthora muscae TaxID=34485 RepID=A0ACC2TAZ4_9FUNG|nr:hypothetical protein DSO57_1033320 [Entomophthora muscae]
MLLFHNISDDSDMEDSDAEDPDAYGYSVLAVPETIAVSYKLCSWKAIMTAKSLPEAKEVVSCLYLTQAKRSPMLVKSSKEAAEVADTVFKNISVLLPLQTFYKEFLGLRCMIEKWDKELAEAQDIMAVLPPFGCTITYVEISIQKVKIKAILDMGSPVNVVSLKLVKKLKLAPSLNYHQLYITSGLSMTCAIGAYSSLPMQFGKLLLAVPAIVLENESYDLLVGTQCLSEYNGIINLKAGHLSILGYEVPLIFEEPVKVPRKRLKTCALEYPTGVFTLKYRTHSSNMKCPPMVCPASEGIPLLATSSVTILPGSQAILDSQISYELPECTFLELYSPPLLGRNKPYLCPGILDVSHKDPVQLLVVNLTALPIHASRGQVVGYGRLLNAPDVLSLHPFGTFQDFNLTEDEPQVLSLHPFGMFQDFNLTEDEPQVLSLFTAQDFPQLSLVQQKEVLDLLDQFLDIFAKNSTDYGLAKGVIHQIDTGDAPPFCAKLYRHSQVEDAQLSKSSKYFWTLYCLLLPKVHGPPPC